MKNTLYSLILTILDQFSLKTKHFKQFLIVKLVWSNSSIKKFHLLLDVQLTELNCICWR